jgi:hypothetical protein
MHDEVLTEKQKRLLPLVKSFSKDFGLVGGTAIALQLGHRRSIDFDLFTLSDFDAVEARDGVRKKHNIQTVFVENPNELTMSIDGVKATFYKFPFKISFSENFKDVIKMPDLLTLGAMKTFALGRRAKWKDYVDLYFIFRKYTIRQISDKAKSLFSGEFNEKLLREELSYFKDIDYSESINYLKGFEIDNIEIERRLEEISLSDT